MKLHTYTNEIINIATANHMAWDIGADMFLANIRNCKDSTLPHYDGADEVDYKALLPHLKDLEDSKAEFVEMYRKHSTAIIELRRRKEYGDVVKLMEG